MCIIPTDFEVLVNFVHYCVEEDITAIKKSYIKEYKKYYSIIFNLFLLLYFLLLNYANSLNPIAFIFIKFIQRFIFMINILVLISEKIRIIFKNLF